MRALPKGKPNELIWITFGGKTFRCSVRTAAHLLWTQQELDKKHPGCKITVFQGCYNIGVLLSVGTHDKDRVLDVAIVGLDWAEAQRFLRAHGWAAWVREPPAFDWHIHMISLGGTTEVGVFVPGQIDDYYRHTFGLKNQHNTDLDKSWFPGDDGPPPWPIGTPEQWRKDIDATLFDFALWERELEDDMQQEDWVKLRGIMREEIDAAIADAAENISVDVGKKHDWSLDTVLRTLVNRKKRQET